MNSSLAASHAGARFLFFLYVRSSPWPTLTWRRRVDLDQFRALLGPNGSSLTVFGERVAIHPTQTARYGEEERLRRNEKIGR